MNAPVNSAEIGELRNKQMAPREASLPAVRAGFFDLQAFELIQRVSKAFAQSDLVPNQYQGNLANCMIAMDMSQRIGANPLMVMQNLYIVHGTPGWSSKFLIATINACGRYSSLRYEWKGEPGQKDYGCRAWAIERETGERLNGIWVTWEMVKAEGWDAKNGSKWKTMPDQMFVYRSAAFWQRAYAPELGMGLQTTEDLEDAFVAQRGADGTFSVDISALKQDGEANNGSDNVDAGTGEIIYQSSGTSKPANDGPTLNDALAAANAGDIDTARDLARGLTDEERQKVDDAIVASLGGGEGQQQTGTRRRERGGMSVE